MTSKSSKLGQCTTFILKNPMKRNPMFMQIYFSMYESLVRQGLMIKRTYPRSTVPWSKYGSSLKLLKYREISRYVGHSRDALLTMSFISLLYFSNTFSRGFCILDVCGWINFVMECKCLRYVFSLKSYIRQKMIRFQFYKWVFGLLDLPLKKLFTDVIFFVIYWTGKIIN